MEGYALRKKYKFQQCNIWVQFENKNFVRHSTIIRNSQQFKKKSINKSNLILLTYLIFLKSILSNYALLINYDDISSKKPEFKQEYNS